MIEFISANFVPMMFAGLLVFLLSGFPVAFALAEIATVFVGKRLPAHRVVRPSAQAAVPIHRFDPVMTQSSPSRRA